MRRHRGVCRRMGMRMRGSGMRVMRMFVGSLTQRCRRGLMGMGIVGVGGLLVVTHVTGVTRMRRRSWTTVMARIVAVPGRIVLTMIVVHILLRDTGRWFEVWVFDARGCQWRRLQVVLRRDRGVDLRG